MHSEAHIDAPTVTTSRTTSDVARSGMVQLRRWGLRDDVMSGAPPISRIDSAVYDVITSSVPVRIEVDAAWATE